ncbi:hypothetical protein ACIQ7Q_01120 [Streptomyces sp. NPDC096176]|uniref:DUF7144 family membrane protein n=1 Tax=Streptomyces sp. NPDC096176 TaxID=3366079 RepID=UPI00382DA9CA
MLVLAGFALFRGAVQVRALGIALAGLGLIANFLWLPHHPFRALALIALDVFVIRALCLSPWPGRFRAVVPLATAGEVPGVVPRATAGEVPGVVPRATAGEVLTPRQSRATAPVAG